MLRDLAQKIDLETISGKGNGDAQQQQPRDQVHVDLNTKYVTDGFGQDL